MSRALRMRVCIQEVKDTMKGLNERNQICGVLVRAMSSHSSAEDRANYYKCFQINKNIRNAEINFFWQNDWIDASFKWSFFYYVWSLSWKHGWKWQDIIAFTERQFVFRRRKKKNKKLKQAFDAGYLQACKQFKEQVATFDAQFVLLNWSSGNSYYDEKFLPRSFTLYTLVQRHLLQKEI